MKSCKMIAVILAFVMLFTMAACGNNAANTPTQAPASSAPTQTPTETPTEAPATEAPAPVENEAEDLAAIPKEDYGGRVFKFASWFKTVMTSDDPEPNPADSTYSEAEVLHYNALHQFMEDYNCSVEFLMVPQEEIFTTFTTSVMAGDPFADVVMIAPGNIVSAIKNQQIMSIDEYVPAGSDPYTTQKWSKPGVSFMGKSWYLEKYALPMDAYLMGINLDIIAAIGAEDPRTLYQNGQWTWDKFVEIAKLAASNTSSTGMTDQWGLTGWTQWILEALIASNDGTLVGPNGENGLTDPKTVRALEFFDQIYNIDKVAYLSSGGIWDWGGNMDAYQQGNSAFFLYLDWQGGAGNIGYNWGVVPFPKGPDNNVSGVYPTFFKGFVQANCVPRGVKNPEQIYPLLEKACYGYFGEQKEVEDSGVRGWFETSCFVTAEDVDLNILISGEGWKVDFQGSVANLPLGDIMTNLTDGSMTPAQAVETFKQPMQDAIDVFYN